MIYTANGVLYRTTRTAIGGMWSPSTQVDLGGFVIPAGSTLRAPKLSPDGVQMFFAMQDMVGATTMQYVTRSSATSTGWNLPALVTYADAGFTVTSIAWGPSTHVVIGSTNVAGPGAIYDATFDLTNKMVTNFMMIKGGGSNPYITADGMHLYYDALDGSGGSGLFVASRRAVTELFAPAVQLVELSNGDSVDTAAWVPSGGHTIYYASQRTGATVPSLVSATRVSF
jgi:hypothetical protein